MHRFVCPLDFDYCQGEKVKTVNCIATLILVEMGRYVKICTYYKNQVQCEIPGLSVE